METIGDEPPLRFEVNIANAHTLYPGSETPPKDAGVDFISVALRRKPAPYDNGAKPHINLYELAKGKERYSGGRFVHDDRAVSNIIYGYAKNLPPYDPKNRGHYHPESSEYWLIMAGQVKYPVERQSLNIPREGAGVSVPPVTFHAPRCFQDGAPRRFVHHGLTDI